jgi:thiol-disulfide isomerase/thioredoxin
MKYKLTAILVLALWGSTLAAQDKEIEFDTLTLAQACKKAAAENKLVFVDCYTTWCIPCKHMEANVFKVDSVAHFFNTTFINIKMDMDKAETKEAGKKYSVGAYPSYLLVDKDGNLVYKFVGGMSAGEFMAKVRTGLHPDNEVAVMNERYAAGERSPEFMRKYIRLKIHLMEIETAKQLNAELMGRLSAPEKAKAENWVLFGSNRYALYLSEVGSLNFNYLADHWRDFLAENSKDTIDLKLATVYRKIAGVFISGQYHGNTSSKLYLPSDIPLFKKQIEGTEMPDKAQLLVLMDMSQAAVNKEYDKATQLLIDHVEQFTPANQSIIFDYLWMCFSIPGYKYDGFTIISDKIARTSSNPHLIKICEEYKKKEQEAHAK